MRKILFFSFLLFNCFPFFSQEQEMPWDSKKRIEDSHSFKIDEERSFHVVSYKDLKISNYGFTPFITNTEGFTREFESVNFEKLPSVLSHRLTIDRQHLILLVAYQKHDTHRALELIAYDWESGKKISKEKVSLLKNSGVVVQNSEAMFVVQQKDTAIFLRPIKKSTVTEATAVRAKYLSTMDSIFENGVQWVDQNEYVAHGSVYPSKIYENQGKLYFVLQKKKTFKVITLETETPENQAYGEFYIEEIQKFQDTYSYVFKDKLLVFYYNVNDINIEIMDIASGETLKSYSLIRDFKSQINRREIAPLMNKFKEPKHHLTAAVNEGLQGELVISFDYVDVDAYKYGKDSYFNSFNHEWFQQQWFWQQQMMHQQHINNAINNFNKGGPNAENYPMETAWPLVKEEEEPVRLSVSLQADLSIYKEASIKTRYPNAANHPVFKAIKENKKLRHSSATVSGQECRYIYYDKKTKALKIGSSSFEK